MIEKGPSAKELVIDAYLTTMYGKLAGISENNSVVLTEPIDLLRNGRISSFRELEENLRKYNNRKWAEPIPASSEKELFCIASPIRSGETVIFPTDRKGAPGYKLNLVYAEPSKITEILEDFNSDRAKNLKRLERTGYVPPKNSRPTLH